MNFSIEAGILLQGMYAVYTYYMYYIFQVNALLGTLEFQESAKCKGHFALYNCLVLGQKFLLHSNRQLAENRHVMCVMEKAWFEPRTLGTGADRATNCATALVGAGSYQIQWCPTGLLQSISSLVSPDTVWYARVLLLFSASGTIDTGSKSRSFECALVSMLETYDDPENGNYINYINL